MKTLHLIMRDLPDPEQLSAEDHLVWFDRPFDASLPGHHESLGKDLTYSDLVTLLRQFDRVETW